jgi:subtilisin family serine protease
VVDPAPSSRVLALAVLALTVAGTGVLPAQVDSVGGTGLFVVELTDPPLTRYRGTVADIPATDPEVTDAGRLDPRDSATLAYLDHLVGLQHRCVGRIAAALGRWPRIVYRYVAVANGIALELTDDEAAAVAGVGGVLRLRPSRDHHPATDAGPAFLGAPAVWDGTVTASLPGSRGEGVVIGVVDTGINSDHPSFSATPPDGHVFTNPHGQGVFIGWCDPDHPGWDPTFACNDKLVGAWDFVDAISAEDDGPEDGHGHGSHVAGIAAGNTLNDPPVSGVAPHANLIAYDVCYRDPVQGETCPEAAIIAAVDQAVLDGVDVLNLSLGGGLSPWTDVDALLLQAVAAGVFVAAAADNQGPQPGTVAHRGPWVATIGASTHDRVANQSLLIDLAGGFTPPTNLVGASLTAGWGPAPVVWAGSFDNGTPAPELCLEPFPAGTWSSGEIVVCDHASGFPLTVCENVADGGAGACVVANSSTTTPVQTSAHVIPGIHVDAAAGDALRAWLAAGTGHTATLTDAEMITDPAAGDLMASSSSRGPAGNLEIIKPDLVAPGIRILAPLASGVIPGFDGDEFFHISGTSMATAFATGGAALLRALRPRLRPMQLRSALAMTAVTTLDDGGVAATPFARGSGRIDLPAAARAGLVMDESASAMAAADPAQLGQPRSLNLPALVDGSCAGLCRWRRTLSAVEPGTVVWAVTTLAPAGLDITVEPTSFASGPVGSQPCLHIAARIGDALPLDEWVFAEVRLSPDDPELAELHLPVALVASAPLSLVFADGFESGDAAMWE